MLCVWVANSWRWVISSEHILLFVMYMGHKVKLTLHRADCSSRSPSLIMWPKKESLSRNWFVTSDGIDQQPLLIRCFCYQLSSESSILRHENCPHYSEHTSFVFSSLFIPLSLLIEIPKGHDLDEMQQWPLWNSEIYISNNNSANQ